MKQHAVLTVSPLQGTVRGGGSCLVQCSHLGWIKSWVRPAIEASNHLHRYLCGLSNRSRWVKVRKAGKPMTDSCLIIHICHWNETIPKTRNKLNSLQGFHALKLLPICHDHYNQNYYCTWMFAGPFSSLQRTSYANTTSLTQQPCKVSISPILQLRWSNMPKPTLASSWQRQDSNKGNL